MVSVFSESSDNEEELCDIDVNSLLEEEDSNQDLDNIDLLIVSVLKVLLRWQSLFYVSDLAFSYLLLLVKSVLYLVSATSEFTQELYKKFPSNLYQLNKSISFRNDMFRKYAVCTKCFAIYDFSECVDVIEGVETSKKCTNVLFPNHALRHFRKSCGEFLLKSVTINGKKKLIPRKKFVIRALKKVYKFW